MARTSPQMNIRIPESLLERLRQAAQDNHRSLTGEVLHRLEQSFETQAIPNRTR